MKRFPLFVFASILVLSACTQDNPVAPSDLQPAFARQPRLPHSYTFEKGMSADWELFKSPVGGDYWYVSDVDPLKGKFSARSGVIVDSKTTGMQMYVTCEEGAQISYLWKTDSQVGDKLALLVNGGWAWQAYGNSGGPAFNTVPLSPGTYYVQFVYQKDSSGSSGQDAAWLDNIQFKKCRPAS